MTRSLIAAAMAIAVSSAATAAQKPDAGENPIIGVWKLNPERSTFDPAPAGPAPQSNIRLYVDRGDEGIVALTHTIGAQGIPDFNMSVSRYDGAPAPAYNGVRLADFLAAGTPSNNTMAYRAIDRYTTEVTIRVDGAVTGTFVRTVSKDRRTMTETTRGTNAEGRPFHNVVVYEAVCGNTQFHRC